MGEKYFPASIKCIKAGVEGYFVRNLNNNTTSYIKEIETEILSSLTGSKTIEKHLETISSLEKYNLSSNTLRETAQKWIKKGLLRNEELLMKKNNKSDLPPSEKGIIKKIISGIVTCRRPQLLEKNLSSRIGTEEYSKIQPQIIVCDDTKEKKIREKNLIIIKKYGKEYKGEITYIDYEYKKEFSENLKKAIKHSELYGIGLNNKNIPDYREFNIQKSSTVQKNISEAIDFALSLSDINSKKQRTTGSNRNLLLLASAGSKLYSSDDDIEYSVYENDKINKEYFFSDEAVLNIHFFENMRTVENQLEKKQKSDILSILQKITGKDPRTVPEIGNSTSFSNINPETAYLMEKGNLKINSVTTGLFGFRWYNNPLYPLLIPNSVEYDFIFNKDRYKKVINNGFNILEYNNPFFHRNDFIIGANYSINNTELTPPCFPYGNREDIVASKIRQKTLSAGLNLNLTQIIKHNSINENSFIEKDYKEVSIGVGTYSTLIIDYISPDLICPNGLLRLKELGDRIMGFSESRYSDFLEQIILIQLDHLSKALTRIDYVSDIYYANNEWLINDLLNYKKLLINEAEKINNIVPFEFRITDDISKDMKLFKDYLFKCGEMLYWWPEIWEAAKNLNMEGRGLIKLSE